MINTMNELYAKCLIIIKLYFCYFSDFYFFRNFILAMLSTVKSYE